MDISSVDLLLGVLLTCLILSAFFSGSETAMLSLNRYRLKHQSRHNRGARHALELLERPDRLIGLILTGNTLVNILASSIAAVVAVEIWGDAAVVIETVVLTIVILVFSEVTPKTLAALYPERVAFPASYLLKGLMHVLYPVVWSVNAVSNGILRIVGVDAEKRPDETLSSDELRTIVVESGPLIPQRHKRMLLNILDLEQVTVDDIMIPRHDIYGIDVEDGDAEIIAKLRATEHTRVVLYREDIGNVLGILHMRLVSQFVHGDQLDRDTMLRLANEPYFVPESTPLHLQLRNFQKGKRRIGIVVDEYGTVLGLVTLEDILEEIVGEFTSNLPDASPEIVQQADGSYMIDGAASIREINRSLHWKLPVDGPKTLNGLLLEYLEAIPEAHVGLRIGDYFFEIQRVQDKVIQSVRAQHRASA